MHLVSQQSPNVSSILVMQYHIVDRDVAIVGWPGRSCVVGRPNIRVGRVFVVIVMGGRCWKIDHDDDDDE